MSPNYPSEPHLSGFFGSEYHPQNPPLCNNRTITSNNHQSVFETSEIKLGSEFEEIQMTKRSTLRLVPVRNRASLNYEYVLFSLKK